MSTGEARHHQVLLSAGTSVLLVIGIGSYILRLWSRRMSGVQLWYDDYCIGLGLVRVHHSITASRCNFIEPEG